MSSKITFQFSARTIRGVCDIGICGNESIFWNEGKVLMWCRMQKLWYCLESTNEWKASIELLLKLVLLAGRASIAVWIDIMSVLAMSFFHFHLYMLELCLDLAYFKKVSITCQMQLAVKEVLPLND
ncbi:hypothetical protein E3Q18_04226 [Wallemia mellicola]|nr:hypothetical protein E3Q18_04226 [Wallemia mellicola]